jgi:hypothetical protein
MTTDLAETENPARATHRRRLGPIISLLFLAPILSELLSGSTRVSTLFVLIPSTGVWGCAALIIREIARRRRRTWRSLVMHGLALSLAEECVIQQTSLAPLISVDPQHVYSRAFGVDWEYLLWALGFESVWVVTLPIALTEYLFPERREETWLGPRGLVIAAAVFALASFVAWYSLTQVFLPKFFPQSIYHPPAATFVMALAAIASLATVALAPEQEIGARPESNETVPGPWVIGMVSFGLALPWYLQVLLAFGAIPSVPVSMALFGGLALAAVALTLANRWSARRAWGENHTFAAIIGIILATLVGGSVVLRVSRASPIDRIGQLAFNFAALGLLIRHARRRGHDNPRRDERKLRQACRLSS